MNQEDTTGSFLNTHTEHPSLNTYLQLPPLEVSIHLDPEFSGLGVA